MRYADIKYPDTTNGLGIRISLWVQGCNKHCKGCHNPETWNFKGGNEFTKSQKDYIFKILKLPYVQGLSVLGGEPLVQDIELELLLKEIKDKLPNKDIWLWTGYKYEDVKGMPILNYVDVLIDGEFIEDKKNISLPFRGSENQRIIDLKTGDMYGL